MSHPLTRHGDVSTIILSISGQSIGDLTPVRAIISLHGASHPRHVVEDEYTYGTVLSVLESGHDRDTAPSAPVLHLETIKVPGKGEVAGGSRGVGCHADQDQHPTLISHCDVRDGNNWNWRKEEEEDEEERNEIGGKLVI